MKKEPRPAGPDPYFYERQAALYKAFAHPARIHIVDFLAHGQAAVSDLQDELSISAPNLSQHLSILRSAGVVNTRRDGHRLLCELSSREVTDACTQMRKVLDAQRVRFLQTNQRLEASSAHGKIGRGKW